MAQKSRAEQSERTKEKLIEATRDLVVERGWSGASSRAIAERAGVNLALINFHFGGKTKLFQATLDRCVAGVSTKYGPWGSAGSLAEFIQMCVEAAPKISSDANARFVFSAMLEGARDVGIGTAVRRQLELFRKDIGGVVERIGVPAERQQQAIDLIAGTMDGLMIHLILDPSTDAAGALGFLGDALAALISDERG
ncbi:MAG: TetR/AcrR family transcriptional regulator [Acidobacteria bacterium]|nr:TetR/AcrR family transcriptional regulator [Acidobacteriota bacterium]